MPKRVVVVSSTPRKRGNSEALAEEFKRGAQEAGHSVTKINVRDLDMKFCIGCMSCHKTGKCVLKDDINALVDVVQQADVLVFATPVYYYSVSGQLKTFLDRLNPLYVKENSFREVYLLATAAENERSAVDGSITAIQGWIDCFDDVALKGVVYGIGAEGAGEINNTNAPAEAYEMGKNI